MGLKGCRLWAMGQLDSTCRAPPRVQRVQQVLQLPRVGLALTPGCPIGYMEHAGCHQFNVFVTPGCPIGYMEHTGGHQFNVLAAK
jgi:hypothetical protein